MPTARQFARLLRRTARRVEQKAYAAGRRDERALAGLFLKAAPPEPEAGFDGCLLVPLWGDSGDAVKAFAAALDPADVVELEADPHVTVRYGLNATPDEVRAAVADAGPAEFVVTNPGMFAHADQDVLYLNVSQCDALFRLRERLAGLPHRDTYPGYLAHATVAYLKPGTAHKYLGRTLDQGYHVGQGEAVYHPPGKGEPVRVPLCGQVTKGGQADDARPLLLAAMLQVAERHAAAGTDPAAELDALAGLADDPDRLEELLADGGDGAERKGFPLFKAARWDSDKHPRDDGGRFVSRDAIADAKADPAKAERLRERVTDPAERKKLDAALGGDTDLGRTKRGQQRHDAHERRHTRETAGRRVRELTTLARHGEAGADHFRELADLLGQGHLTVEDLRAARSSVGASWGGDRLRKQGMVDRLVAFARGQAGALRPRPAPRPGAKPPARKRPKSDTLAARMATYGKINPADPAFTKYFGTTREAVEQGVPLGVFDSKSTARFDIIAREMAAAGEFYHDEHQEPADALAELLQTGARSALTDRTAEHAAADAEWARQAEQAATEGMTPEEIKGYHSAAEDKYANVTAADLFGDDHAGERGDESGPEGGGRAGGAGPEADGARGEGGGHLHPEGDAGFDFGANAAAEVDDSFDFGAGEAAAPPNPRLDALQADASRRLAQASAPLADNRYTNHSDADLGAARTNLARKLAGLNEAARSGVENGDERHSTRQRLDEANAELSRRVTAARLNRRLEAIRESRESGTLTVSESEMRELLGQAKDAYREDGLRGRVPYSPDHFRTSDLTGAKVRHWVELPDGRLAHPDELHEAKRRGRLRVVPDAEVPSAPAVASTAERLANSPAPEQAETPPTEAADAPRNPYLTGERQLDIFGGSHGTPRPTPPAASGGTPPADPVSAATTPTMEAPPAATGPEIKTAGGSPNFAARRVDYAHPTNIYRDKHPLIDGPTYAPPVGSAVMLPQNAFYDRTKVRVTYQTADGAVGHRDINSDVFDRLTRQLRDAGKDPAEAMPAAMTLGHGTDETAADRVARYLSGASPAAATQMEPATPPADTKAALDEAYKTYQAHVRQHGDTRSLMSDAARDTELSGSVPESLRQKLQDRSLLERRWRAAQARHDAANPPPPNPPAAKPDRHPLYAGNTYAVRHLLAKLPGAKLETIGGKKVWTVPQAQVVEAKRIIAGAPKEKPLLDLSDAELADRGLVRTSGPRGPYVRRATRQELEDMQ